MKEYKNPELTVEEMSVEDVVAVDYTVDDKGQEISWSQMWTSAIGGN